MSEGNQLTVVIGANDPFLRTFIERCVAEHPWFRSLASVPTALQAAQVAGEFQPHLVVLVDESPGLRGRDVLADIAAVLDGPRVVLMSTADLEELRAMPSVADAVAHRDGAALFDALTKFGQWCATPTDYGVDRRTTSDRRVRQDWGQTFAQRRQASRRAGELASA